MWPHPRGAAAPRALGPPRCCPRLPQPCPHAGVSSLCQDPPCPGKGEPRPQLRDFGVTAVSTPGDTFGSRPQPGWRVTVTRWSSQQDEKDVTPLPKPRWAPRGAAVAAPAPSARRVPGGPRPASLGDNDPRLPTPPGCPGPGGSGDSPCPANGHGGGPAPPAPGSPSPGDGTDTPPHRHPRAHRPAVPLCYSRRVWGCRGMDTRHPGELAPRRLHRGHPGSPGSDSGQGSVGGPGDPGPAAGDGEGSPRARAPSQPPPAGVRSPRTGLNWCGGGEAGPGPGPGWQRLARAGERGRGGRAGRAGRGGQGPRSGAAGAGASGQATAGLVPVPSPAGPPRSPVSRGRVVWQALPSLPPPAAALGALGVSAWRGPFPPGGGHGPTQPRPQRDPPTTSAGDGSTILGGCQQPVPTPGL